MLVIMCACVHEAELYVLRMRTISALRVLHFSAFIFPVAILKQLFRSVLLVKHAHHGYLLRKLKVATVKMLDLWQ